MDVVSKNKTAKASDKNMLTNTVNKQTGGPLAGRMRQERMNHRRSKRSGSKPRDGIKTQK